MNSGNQATIKHLTNDSLPEFLSFDSNVIIRALVNPINPTTRKLNEINAAKAFVRRVRNERKAIIIYSSVITEFNFFKSEVYPFTFNRILAFEVSCFSSPQFLIRPDSLFFI